MRCAMALALWALPGLAVAQTVELQVEPRHLGELVQLRMKREHICPLTFTHLGSRFILDLIEFPEGSHARPAPEREPVEISEHLTLNVTPARLHVPIAVGLKTEECMDDPECLDEHAVILATHLIFSLEFEQRSLCAEYVGNDTQFALPPQIDVPRRVCAPLDIGVLTDVIGSDLTLIGKGVGVGETGRLAVRLEYSSIPETVAGAREWRCFFGGNLGPTVPGADWSLYIGQDLIEQRISTLLERNLETVDDFSFDGSPDLSWSPGEDFVEIDVEMSGEYDTGLCGIDMDVDVDTTLHLDGQTLVTHGDIDVDKDFWDTLGCSMAWALPGLFLGPEFYGAVSAAVTAGIVFYEPDLDAAGGGCRSTGDTTFRCDAPLEDLELDLEPNDPTSPHGILRVEHLKGHEDGLLIYGGFQSRRTFNAYRRRLSGSSSLGYGLHGECHSLGIGYHGGLILDGTGRVCNVQIIDDPLGVYSLRKTSTGDWMPTAYEVDFHAPEDDGTYDVFFADPYPLRARVFTTDGAETLVSDPPPDKREFNEIELIKRLAQAKAQCIVAVDRSAWLLWWKWQLDRFDDRATEQDQRVNIAAALEVRMARRFSLLTSVGYDRFKADVDESVDIFNISLNGRFYINKGRAVNFFLHGGPGYYSFSSGEDNFGLNIGGGLQYMVSRRLALEAVYDFTNVFRPGEDQGLPSIRTGIRIRR